ncbi:bifunctional homocysteine S-methyltransferase/5,10-methylenetetrahydrofolate reductase protein [Marinomonas spartinae]|uniref:Bifunctional homocysteine S-methyltransferase/5,10-methylenetetrahydrofolate reductase protein n=1 Tax=Marinomonas spartinae TaxID=1792290 RepID=A0A1A8TEW7_9GAMM|nr:methylenetetrahydrofolate reductase [Marinomonas spartinae]SBS30652.1 bifunctional homocysteine S-methyltransferase/5,10-methylenetetrahydrofolate reductase protein [Marinomonas spartinae]
MKTQLATKFADPSRGVYFIGTTPPKSSVNNEQLAQISQKLLERLNGIDIDGLIVYDIQDESSRIDKPRPFPYLETHDPRAWSKRLKEASGSPVITYKSVSSRSCEEFSDWLQEAWDEFDIRDIVLVGSPSSESNIKLPLSEAYLALQHAPQAFNLGGVTIAERHAKKKDEHIRLMNKSKAGCEFFISQAVYNPQATADLISQYAQICKEQGVAPKRIILTFTPCGSAKTLEFMEWLGISVPVATKNRILNSDAPLAESIKICRSALEQIIETALPDGVPLGLNIESLTNRKEEIDASIHLYKLLKATLDLKLAEKEFADE